jgi:hypothetical protein
MMQVKTHPAWDDTNSVFSVIGDMVVSAWCVIFGCFGDSIFFFPFFFLLLKRKNKSRRAEWWKLGSMSQFDRAELS